MGFLKAIGQGLNDLMGTTSGAELNNKYQKEFAQNAHQWEIKDLEAAGLNPILSAGDTTGATASGGGTVGNSGINPIAMGMNMYSTIMSGKKLAADTQNTDMDTLMKKALTIGYDLDNLIKQGASQAEIDKRKAERDYVMKQIDLIGGETTKKAAETELTKAQTGKTLAETHLTNQEKDIKLKQIEKMEAEIREINARKDLTDEQKANYQLGILSHFVGTNSRKVFQDDDKYEYSRKDPNLPWVGSNVIKKRKK